MNILNAINDNLERFDFDIETKGFFLGFEINQFFESKNVIIDYYSNKRLCVKTMDDFIDLLVLYKYKDFGVFSDYLKSEVKEEYNRTVKFCGELFEQYKPSEYINFINQNIDSIFAQKSVSMCRRITLLITPYFNGCKNSISRMLSECLYVFFPLNDKLKKCILDNEDLVHIILDKKQYETFKYSTKTEYFDFIKDCIKKKTNIEDVDKILEEIYKFGIELCDKCDDKNVLEYLSIIQSIGQFFKDIKNPKAFEFDKNLKALNLLKDKYIIEHGVHHTQRIPIEEFEAYFKNENVPWDVRFLSLTHQRISKDNWKSYYANMTRNKREAFWDLVGTELNKYDEFFTQDRQIDINVKNQIFDLILSRVYVNDENIDKFITQFLTMIASVYKYFKVDYDIGKLDANMKTMRELFINLIHNVDNLELLCGLNYGLSMFICGMIEEFLANLFKQLNIKDKYIDDNHLTLPVLLGDNKMREIFEEDDVKILQYMLLGNDGVGFGYRNKLAHFKTLGLEEINDALVLNLLRIFIYIVNCCFVKIVHSTRKDGE